MGLLEGDAERLAAMQPAPQHRARVAGADLARERIEHPPFEVVGPRAGLECEPDDRAPPPRRACALLERGQVIQKMGFARAR